MYVNHIIIQLSYTSLPVKILIRYRRTSYIIHKFNLH